MYVITVVHIVYHKDIKRHLEIREVLCLAEEISRLTKALSELGVCKIRLTGGEPTVRKDFFDILKDMKQNSNIPKVTMTTNGYRLDKIAEQLQ